MMRFVMLHKRIESILGARTVRLIRYLVSGGTAAASNVIVLFLLVQFAQVYYLYASILAFIFSIAISFTLHKYVTFLNTGRHGVHMQFARYLCVILGNLVLNTALVYVLVEKVAVWYLFAQLLATIVVAVTGYFGYRYFVFCENPPRSL